MECSIIITYSNPLPSIKQIIIKEVVYSITEPWRYIANYILCTDPSGLESVILLIVLFDKADQIIHCL